MLNLIFVYTVLFIYCLKRERERDRKKDRKKEEERKKERTIDKDIICSD